MTGRKDALPPEYQGLNPEEFIDIYELSDGSIATTTRESIEHLLQHHSYAHAFDLMRYQLMRAAQSTLRRAGCDWKRTDRLWWDGDPSPELQLETMVQEASEFVTSLQPQTDEVASALETLQHLRWQSVAIASAGDEHAREALRRMALASTSLGFLAASTGIEGVVPSLREVSAIAEKAQAKSRRQSQAATQTAAKRREVWHPRAKEIARAELSRWPNKTDDALATAIALEAGKDGFSPPGLRQIARAVASWRGAPDGIAARRKNDIR